MKLPDKRTWDRVLYGLIYPGFLGSMLYELVPPKDTDFNWAFFFNINRYIQYLILVFYFLDYIHLYGDMEGAMKLDPNKKDLSYFVCDILTCLGYLFSYIALKIPNYLCAVLVFGVVPWLFRWYKRGNPADRRFFNVYGCINTLIAGGRLIGIWWNPIPITERGLALGFMAFNVVVYGFYIVKYYEKYSAETDKIRFSEAGAPA